MYVYLEEDLMNAIGRDTVPGMEKTYVMLLIDMYTMPIVYDANYHSLYIDCE